MLERPDLKEGSFKCCDEGGISPGAAIIGWPTDKEDRAPAALTVVMKREFQQVSFVHMENLVKSPLHHNT